MKATSLPKRLKKDPLIDAVFEVRFSSAMPAVPASSILPGFFFSKVQGDAKQIERLPVSDFPMELRQSDLNLRFQPLHRLHLDGFLISIGDASVGLACKRPYRGWAEFKEKIIKTIEMLKDSSVIGEIDRYSMRYVNIICDDDRVPSLSQTNLDIKLGKLVLSSEPFGFRVEIARDGLMQVVNIAAPAIATLPDEADRQGMLIDIDVFCDLQEKNFSVFAASLSDKLEKMHLTCKEIFYECLTSETIERLEPDYD